MEKEAEHFFQVLRAHIERFGKVNDSEMNEISGFFTVQKVKKKDLILESGEICRFENFIVSGLFQTAVIDESGKTHTLNFPHENWWVGDYKSFSTSSPSKMRIEAIEDAVLLKISKASFDNLLAGSARFSNYFTRLSENASIAANERIINQLSQTAEKRYELFCQNYSQVIGRLSQKRIASFLGISPEYFNQIEKRKTSKS